MAPRMSAERDQTYLKQRLERILSDNGLELINEDWHLLMEEGYASRWAEASPVERPSRLEACAAFLRRLRTRDDRVSTDVKRTARSRDHAPAPPTAGDR